MSTVTLRWIGDLDQDKREQAGCVSSSSDQYRPKKIELKPGQKEIRIGRINTKIPPDYPIESCINSRMISRNHATIERSAKGGSILYDHSMNGTYVNYTRVLGGVTLKHGDIVCFGHLNGANLKPGEPVALFYSDLKYRVELSESPTKENVTGTAKKRKSYPAQPGSTVSSTQRSDNEDDSIGSSDSESAETKRPKSNTTSSASRTANRQKFKKPASSNRHKVEEDDGDSNDDLDDNSNSKRLSSGGSKTIKKRSNGTDKVKKSHSNSVSRKSGGTKLGHIHNKEKRRSGKSTKSGSFDAEDDTGGGDMFHYDSEECSARPCKQPQDIAIDWIQCDRCTLWYHQDIIESYLELKLCSLRLSDSKLTNSYAVTPSPQSFDDHVNLSNNVSRLHVISTPLPSTAFYEPWHFICQWIRTNRSE
ncbi:Protein FraH isoform 3 [Schistosoma japonicum]|uniref:Protein FraH isoform 3 n=1 Tax=Schistosoma japonicum TaxID=6182 RepID=A0A4Z2DMK3_SCHJA|nr:Protein FraH isoform 3 [Schistosoma japonicum]TNN17690.1 Protein FraH isoform 3 [Schistosoma japonicum]TNN17693.1 Protein FraH isoform 3 [Schistosoma japonicum]